MFECFQIFGLYCTCYCKWKKYNFSSTFFSIHFQCNEIISLYFQKAILVPINFIITGYVQKFYTKMYRWYTNQLLIGHIKGSSINLYQAHWESSIIEEKILIGWSIAPEISTSNSRFNRIFEFRCIVFLFFFLFLKNFWFNFLSRKPKQMFAQN